MLNSLFKPRRAADPIEDRLYAAAVAQARRPGFYTALGVADRIDARFELYTLHVLILVMRLRDEPGGGDAAEIGQRLFDTYVSALDNALRELGVGDISMARKMRNLGEQLYGRMSRWEGPLRSGDADALARALARNVYEAPEGAADAPVHTQAQALAAYALRARAALADQALTSLLADPAWPEAA